MGETTVENSVQRVTETQISTRHGRFTCHTYVSALRRTRHFALVAGEVAGGQEVLVRVHSECLTGDVFGSLRCDCGSQLDRALELIAAEGAGALVYLRGHEGRGIGIAHKLRAYRLQERGRDTVEANLELGLPVDGREYGDGAHILMDLGVSSIRLLTNNPSKYRGLGDCGLAIAGRVPLVVAPTTHNLGYLRTKSLVMGHLMETIDKVRV